MVAQPDPVNEKLVRCTIFYSLMQYCLFSGIFKAVGLRLVQVHAYISRRSDFRLIPRSEDFHQ